MTDLPEPPKKFFDVRIVVIFTVLLLWSASIVAGMVDHSYSIPVTVQVTMGLVAAYLFGDKVLEKTRRKEKADDVAKGLIPGTPPGDRGDDHGDRSPPVDRAPGEPSGKA